MDFVWFCGLSDYHGVLWLIMVHQFPIVSPLKLPLFTLGQELCGGALAFQVSKVALCGWGLVSWLNPPGVWQRWLNRCSTEMELSLDISRVDITIYHPSNPGNRTIRTIHLAGGLKHVNFVIDFRPQFGMSPIVSHILAWPESTNQELFGPLEWTIHRYSISIYLMVLQYCLHLCRSLGFFKFLHVFLSYNASSPQASQFEAQHWITIV